MTIKAQSRTELYLLLNWLKSTGAIKKATQVKKKGLSYTAKVKSNVSNKELRYRVKERVGTFGDVE